MENPLLAATEQYAGEPGILVQISFVVFALTIFAAIVLQFMARRHRRPDAFHYQFKDSLFRQKELVFTERGMRYINLQKNIIIICTLTIVGLLAIDHFLL